MADEPGERGERKSEPTLELPSLFGRKSRREAVADQQEAPEQPQPEPHEDELPGDERSETEPAPRQTPKVPAPITAAVTGVVTGLVGVALSYGAMRGCEAVRGTSSCGGGPGFFMLVAIVIVMVLVGATLLGAWRVAESRGTSLLGVGLVCVVALLVLPAVIFSAWMFLVLPLVAAGCFALSQWVTTRYVDTTESGPDHDVR